ncbi:GNAT family N-acetyltransferase [Erwinia sp. OLTSP20]|uniref:GNAT family N-acetyltransferase n=1 Tax=unclassified Erwinia TaxID=2622719 RepID=UPI000C19C1BE|nr:MULTISPECIES: GNAT family N-acetyltransferase [unclassified Erwinia]PIJ50440.1 GNAT family N-acetyltransferase [Erwinia sp. OAMSP11]PIJ72511.1 GNAT family N-acetyltransferase [Erwinia sp. OLSSP12]PIJ81749.1 GNAT family N-acetyltransferase [Erwinia sp. OLCASP19]PIJ84342.1 GNAT family N-acetyltransferase [Erwinia sp. OLMTSP26]PIJ86206.1 GNAT family N-acetyltransferase [Erwinia sp. OLMDSP33]
MSLTPLNAINAIPAASWDALLTDNQPFVRHAFLSALEESGCVRHETGWQPQHLIWQEQGKILAAMPGYRKYHSRGEYIFDHAWADASQRAGLPYYPKWLSAIPFSPVSGARVLGDNFAAHQLLDRLPDWLNENGLYSGHINFSDAPADRLLAPQQNWLQRYGCQYHWYNLRYRDFNDFLDTLMSRKRKNMRKERQAVRDQGFDFVWYQGNELTGQQWDFVYQCYANTYAVRGQRPYLNRLFFSLLAESMPAAIRVVIAQRQSLPVAMAFSLVDDHTFYGRYWGCLAEFDHLHFETCFYQDMDYMITHGLSRFDAGAQGEHKLVRGFLPVVTHSWHLLQHAGLHAAVADYLQQERPAVQAWADQARQALPYHRQAG